MQVGRGDAKERPLCLFELLCPPQSLPPPFAGLPHVMRGDPCSASARTCASPRSPTKGHACSTSHSKSVCITRYRPPFEEFEIRRVVVRKPSEDLSQPHSRPVCLPVDEGPQVCWRCFLHSSWGCVNESGRERAQALYERGHMYV